MKILTPMKAMRAKCLDCGCGSAAEVRLCTVTHCAPYPLRFGKRPATVARRQAKEATV